MEPAAPGTEDDVKNALPTNISKKESEQERLLSLRARLPAGTFGKVFDLSYINGSEHWYCNLCQCPVMGRVYHHEIGKRHTNNMANSGKHAFATEEALQIAPGEPIPPGFEGEIKKVAMIQDRLDSFTNGPLIGLEYLFELHEYDHEKEPSYLCLLCDKRGDPRTVITHLASYNHIIQYTQRHFVSCYRALSPYITKQYKRNWQFTIQKIAEAIEVKFGRLTPHVVDRDNFDKKRGFFQKLVASGPHFNETQELTFKELVDIDKITKTEEEVTMTRLSDDFARRTYRRSGTEIGNQEENPKKRSPSPPYVATPKKPKPAQPAPERRRSLSSVSSISSSDLSDFDANAPNRRAKAYEEKRRYPQQDFRRRRSLSRSPRRIVRRSRSRSRSRSRARRSRSPTRRSHERKLLPWLRSDYIKTRGDVPAERPKQRSDKMDEFKKLAVAIENDMERVKKQHEKNPEKHPMYNDEWKGFWNKRYRELQVEGHDARNHDFKPEWIKYWNRRMLELHNCEIKTKKDALRKRLGLPEELAPISFKILPKKATKSVKDAPKEKQSFQDSEVIVIDDKDEDSISSKRSHSPWESDPGSRPQSRRSREKSRGRMRGSRDRSRERNRLSRDRSRNRYRSRSRSRDKDRSWRMRNSSRERDYNRDYNSRDKDYYRDGYRKADLPTYIKPPRVMRDVTRHPVHSPPTDKSEVDLDDGEVNVVGVLRLLTALEEKLGSLGPKVIDLLGQALAMEKTEANSSETLLDNDINCVLFETIKEKLKGQLLAGLVDYSQQKAFKNATKKIASLVHFAGERKKEKEKDKPKVDPIKVPGIGTIDKAAIARQIATALVLQGKTDVTQIELEQLINAVVGMTEASKSSSKPMTTASFLQQITQGKPGLKSELLDASSDNAADSGSSSMEGLSDSDLQTLLQNFKDLCTEEQHSLISYLKKLEAREPERVERLRKFVTLEGSSEKTDKEVVIDKKMNRRPSPFADRFLGLNPTVEDKVKVEVKVEVEDTKPFAAVPLDSDDEDYSYEDVFKAVKKNIKEKEENERKVDVGIFKTDDFDLSNAKSLISNIMGQFKAKNEASKSATNLLGLNLSTSEAAEAPPSVALPKNLDTIPINIANITSALNTAQQASKTINNPNSTFDLNPTQTMHPPPLMNTPQVMNPRPTIRLNLVNQKYQNNPQYSSSNVAYPSQHLMRPNQFNRPNFEPNRMPFGGNNTMPNSNQFMGGPRGNLNRAPGSSSFPPNQYGNRW